MARPRVSSDAAVGGALFGGVIGGLVARSVAGAAVGAGLGAIAGAGDHPMGLEPALRRLVAERGWEFVSLRRLGRHRADLAFQVSPRTYRLARAEAPSRLTALSDIDDALYDAFVTTFNEAAAHGHVG